MVEPAFLALTSTPSIAPSAAELTRPVSALCARETRGNMPRTSNVANRMAPPPEGTVAILLSGPEIHLALIDAEHVGEPVDHELLAEGRVVVLAMLGAGFLGARQAQGGIHPLRPRVVVHGLRILHAEDVVAAVQHEVGAAHLLQHALELEGLRLLDRLRHALRAEHPLHVVGEGVALAAVAEALLDVPDRAMRDAGREPVLLRARARRVVAAKAGAAHRDLAFIDVLPFLQPIDTPANRKFVVEAGRHLVPPQRRAL